MENPQVKRILAQDKPDSSVESIAGELNEMHPAPSEHAIAAEEAKEQNRANEFADLKDSQGFTFDPEIHLTDSSGKPQTTPTGRLKRKPGRKKNQATRPASVLGGVSTPGGGIGPQQAPNSRAVAVATVDGIMALGLVAGGEEWAYRRDEKQGIDERLNGVEVFERYFNENGVTDIPPGIGIAIWAASYAIPRFFAPKTKGRLARAWDYLRVKFGGARTNPGNDGKRKNDSGDAISGSV